MHTFYQLGKNMHFPPFFIPFQSFFFPNLLFDHIFVKQKNIRPCEKENKTLGGKELEVIFQCRNLMLKLKPDKSIYNLNIIYYKFRFDSTQLDVIYFLQLMIHFFYSLRRRKLIVYKKEFRRT